MTDNDPAIESFGQQGAQILPSVVFFSESTHQKPGGIRLDVSGESR